MDPLLAKREKEREKKRKQREKLKNNENKLRESRQKDAARKRAERAVFKAEVENHPKKYCKVLENLRQLNVTRVRRHRVKTADAKQESESKNSAQKLRRKREKKRSAMKENRESEKMKKEKARQRVQNFRLRIKLKSKCLPVSPSNIKCSPADPESAYKHKSSEARALKRAKDSMPETPAKKVRIIEKLIAFSTPRSRRALSESPSLHAVVSNSNTRRKLDTDYKILDSLVTKGSASRRQRLSTTQMVASKLLKKSRKISAVAKTLGLNRKTLGRKVLNPDESRKTRHDKLNTETIETVQEFYLQDASRQMPNKRDVLLVKTENGEKQHIQKHVMEMTQEEAYSEFKKKNPNVKLSKRKFDLLKPQNVRNTKISNRIVCCCTYCENIRLKVKALNKFNQLSPNMTSTELLEKTLCEKAGPFHPMKCIIRECDSCGCNKLEEEYSDLLMEKGNETILWSRWERSKVALNEEKSVVRVVLVSHKTTLRQFFDELCTSLSPHSQHVMRATWQHNQFRQNMNTLKDGEIIMAMDFAENYTCRYGREIQSFHWNQKQITVHPMMLYYLKDGQLQKEGFMPMTDDLKHDAFAVSEFENLAIQHLRDKGVSVNVIHQWTDGCAGQYKGRHSFAAISKAEELYNAQIVRNYYETSHGKGPCDGLGGIVKRKASNAMLQDENLIISSAQELVEFCVENLSDVGKSSSASRAKQYETSSRSFKFVPSIDRSESTTAKTLTGSRKVHSVMSTGMNFQLKTRDLSCYCEGCRTNEQCSNSEYVKQWEVRLLRAADSETANQDNNHDTEMNDAELQVERVEECPDDFSNLTLNDFVAMKFETKRSKVCYFSKVVEIDGDELCIEYLERHGDFYQYPDKSEQSWQDSSDILCKLPKPDIHIAGSRVKCKFNLIEKQEVCLEGYRLK